MAKFQLKEVTQVEASVVTEVAPAFHGITLVALDDGSVQEVTTAIAVGDYFVIPSAPIPAHFQGKAEFESLYVPLAS